MSVLFVFYSLSVVGAFRLGAWWMATTGPGDDLVARPSIEEHGGMEVHVAETVMFAVFMAGAVVVVMWVLAVCIGVGLWCVGDPALVDAISCGACERFKRVPASGQQSDPIVDDRGMLASGYFADGFSSQGSASGSESGSALTGTTFDRRV